MKIFGLYIRCERYFLLESKKGFIIKHNGNICNRHTILLYTCKIKTRPNNNKIVKLDNHTSFLGCSLSIEEIF